MSERQRTSHVSSIALTVNGDPYELRIGIEPNEIPPSRTLADVLRDTLGHTGLWESRRGIF